MSDSLPVPTLLPPGRLNGSSFDTTMIECVLRETAAGDSIADIVDRHRISSNSVLAIRRLNGETIAQFKQDFAQRNLGTAAYLGAKLEQHARNGELDPDTIGLTMSRLIENAAQLLGEPSQRIQVTVDLGLDSLTKELEELKALASAKPVIES